MGSNLPLKFTYKHYLTTEQKLHWWGYGEWGEEPDVASFEYKGYKCHVQRIIYQEDDENGTLTGGHFCGYVAIPMEHPYAMEDEIFHQGNVHGGITFSEGNDEDWVIGFDCAHASDVIPSMPVQEDYLTRYFPEIAQNHQFERSMNKIEKLQKRTYKNLQFCVNECIKLVDEVDSIPLLKYAPLSSS